MVSETLNYHSDYVRTDALEKGKSVNYCFRITLKVPDLVFLFPRNASCRLKSI